MGSNSTMIIVGVILILHFVIGIVWLLYKLNKKK